MIKNKPVLTLIGLFAVCACILAPAPAETPEGGPTETGGMTEVPPTATPEPSATYTPTATIPPGFFPIAVGFSYTPGRAILLGGTEDGAWINAADAVARLSGGETYTLYAPTGPVGTVIGTMPTEDRICPEYYFDWRPEASDKELIGLGGGWNALPRIPVEPAIADFPTYTAAAGDWLAAQGMSVPSPMTLTGVRRVDLDGDGTMEAIISATRLSDAILHDAAAGDFTIVLLYRETASETILLAGDLYPAARSMVFPRVYSLSSILDLNGDGRMEVIVHYDLFEGDGTKVFSFDGSAADLVFDTWCSY